MHPLPWQAEHLADSIWIHDTTGERRDIEGFIYWPRLQRHYLHSKPRRPDHHLAKLNFMGQVDDSLHYLGNWLPTSPERYHLEHWVRIDHLPPDQMQPWLLRERDWLLSMMSQFEADWSSDHARALQRGYHPHDDDRRHLSLIAAYRLSLAELINELAYSNKPPSLPCA